MFQISFNTLPMTRVSGVKILGAVMYQIHPSNHTKLAIILLNLLYMPGLPRVTPAYPVFTH
jgi:hypothetical protein